LIRFSSISDRRNRRSTGNPKLFRSRRFRGRKQNRFVVKVDKSEKHFLCLTLTVLKLVQKINLWIKV
jgi:hypothetical protein